MFFRKGSSVWNLGFDWSLLRDANSTVLVLKWGTVTVLPMNFVGRDAQRLILACEQHTHFRSSLLSLPKIASANPSSKTIPWRKIFCFDVGQSDQRMEYSPSDSSRPHVLKCLGFWPELPNTLWNVNFTTITRFPATLNADFFMKQLLLKLCMWCGPLVSLYKIR